MDKREKKDMKSPRKQLHKEYFTKRLFSKSIPAITNILYLSQH
jgi:hypothetical protein